MSHTCNLIDFPCIIHNFEPNSTPRVGSCWLLNLPYNNLIRRQDFPTSMLRRLLTAVTNQYKLEEVIIVISVHWFLVDQFIYIGDVMFYCLCFMWLHHKWCHRATDELYKFVPKVNKTITEDTIQSFQHETNFHCSWRYPIRSLLLRLA